MRKTAMGIAMVAVLLLVGGSAAAQPEGDWRRQCYGPGGPTLEELETTKCVKHGDGQWERVTDSDFPGMGFGFGEIILIGIVLALVPGFVGASVASSANISPGAGFLIGTFGSWIGVITLYLYGHYQKRTPAFDVGGPAVERGRPAREDPAERLRKLQELLDQGLITQEEYRARRQAAIDGL